MYACTVYLLPEDKDGKELNIFFTSYGYVSRALQLYCPGKLNNADFLGITGAGSKKKHDWRVTLSMSGI